MNKLTPLQLAMQTASAARRDAKTEWDEEHPACGKCGDPKPIPHSAERMLVRCVRWCDCGLQRVDNTPPVSLDIPNDL